MKYVNTIYCLWLLHLLTPSLQGGIADDLKNGANQIAQAPNLLQQIPQQLKTMFNTINGKVAEVTAGIQKIDDSIKSIAAVKKSIEPNTQIPEEVKNKILAALNQLQTTLPIVRTVFVNLQTAMNTIVTNQNAEMSPITQQIDTVINQIRGGNGIIPLSIRLQSLGNFIAPLETVEQGLQKAADQLRGVGQKITDAFQDAGQKIRHFFQYGN